MNTKNLFKAALAAATAMSLVACSSGDSGSAGGTADGAGHANEVTVALNAQFTTLDPGLNTEVINNHVLENIYQGLFQKDENNVAQKMICEDYTVTDDGLVYTFTLKDGVKWNDGTPVTAYNFEYGILRTLSYGADNAYACNNLNNFIAGAKEYNEAALAAGESFDCTVEDHSSVGVHALDDTTLEVTLKMPCAYLTGLMCGGVWYPVPLDTPQHDSSWSMKAGYVTNGAYDLVEFSENEEAVLVKNETYFWADEITMDKVNYLVMTDEQAQEIAFKNGEIDVATKVSTDTALSHSGTDTLWLINTPVNYFLAINSGSTGPEWAKKVNVRKALAMAIDREALVSVLGGNELRPVTYGYVPYGLGGNTGDYREEGDKTANHPAYDPEGAIALLAQEGYDASNPLHIVYKYSNNSVHGDVATVLQQMWQAIGVDVEFAAVESGVFYDQLDSGDFEIARYGLSASDSPIQYLDLWTRGMQVVAAVDDEKFDQMVLDTKYIADAEEYIDACHDVEAYLYDENVLVIPLFQSTSQYLVTDGLKGHHLNGSMAFYGNCTWAE